MNRATTLNTALSHVTKDRQATHGKPENTFGMIADLWSTYTGVHIQPHDVALMLGLLKIARGKSNPHHEDNFVDLAGYAACGAELAENSTLVTKED